MAGKIITVPTVREPRGYSHAVRAGNTIYLAGQVGIAPNGQLAGDGGFEAQAVEAFENLRRVLEAAGASLADVVKVTVLLVDRDTAPQWREIRGRYFRENLPASTLIIVAGLADPRFLIEIDAVAVVG